MMDVSVILTFIITGLSSVNCDALISDYNNPNNEYIDIDEGAIVKVEFSKTLRKVKWFYTAVPILN